MESCDGSISTEAQRGAGSTSSTCRRDCLVSWAYGCHCRNGTSCQQKSSIVSDQTHSKRKQGERDKQLQRQDLPAPFVPSKTEQWQPAAAQHHVESTLQWRGASPAAGSTAGLHPCLCRRTEIWAGVVWFRGAGIIDSISCKKEKQSPPKLGMLPAWRLQMTQVVTLKRALATYQQTNTPSTT